MKVEQFTHEAAVLNIISQLKEEKIYEKEFSDVIDGVHQYVDLVMEGGGVLGVALAGYVYVLEQMNIR
ncbi:MAG: Patatin, partial [Bacteroidetes bacterium]|nr:Patatin [Bacteroidota bacterium]